MTPTRPRWIPAVAASRNARGTGRGLSSGVDGGLTLCATLFLCLPLLLMSNGAQAEVGWQPGGDIRVGYVRSETRARSGDKSSSDSLRMRARFSLRRQLDDNWRFGGRLAARLDTEQDDEKFWLRWHSPGPTGLSNGQATIDELYLDYLPAGLPWSLRMGRFQASFGLADVMKRSLDQNDSPNFNVTWTDGVWLRHRSSAFSSHLMLRHNTSRGPTGALRPPLNFADGGSRASLFLAFEANAALGPLVQRMVSVTWLPSALEPLGPGDGAEEDYLAVTAKSTAEWPLGTDGRKFRLGAEVGYAPNTPRRETMGSGSGDAEVLSWQTSFNIMDVVPKHDVAVVYGRVADGWLLSTDFRPNDSLIEARWVWKPSDAWQVDARIRRREEMDLPAFAARSRRTDDVYVRVTRRF